MSESIWNDPRITAYALDELPPHDREAFELELRNNPELVAAVEEARGVTEKLDALFAAETIPPLDATRRQAIIAGETQASMGVEATQTDWVTLRPKRAWYQLNAVEWGVTAAIVLILCAIAIPANLSRQVALNETAREKENEALVKEKSAEMAQTGNELLEADDAMSPAASPMMAMDADRDAKQDASPRSPSGLRSSVTAPQASERGEVAARKRHRASLDNSMDQLSVSSAPVSSPHDPASGQDSGGVGGAGQESAASVMSDSVEPSAPQAKGARQAKGAPPSPAAMALDAGPAPETQREAGQPLSFSANSSMSRKAMLQNRSAQDESANEITEAEKSEVHSLGAVSPMSIDNEAAAGDAGSPTPPHELALGKNKSKDRSKPTAERILAEPSEAVPATAPPAMEGFAMDLPARGARVLQHHDGLGTKVTPTRSHDSKNLGRPPASNTLDEEVTRPEGAGPGTPGDQFDFIEDNPFRRVSEHPLSTFSVDVDTASYSKVRDFLVRANQLPRPDAVRIEEMVNYFDYHYAPPAADDEHPFAARAVVTECPWNSEHRLARIALKGKVIERSERAPCNLVFLLDTSGSMNQANKLPLVQTGMKMLLKQLNENDRVAIVVYAGSAGLVLDSTIVKNGKKIRKALTQLSAGGSTDGGSGIALAYQVARDHFIKDGVNRVILCTDGDFNVGTTGTDALVRMVEKEARGNVFLSVLGFGMGNHNDSMLEQISGRGNGNYAFIDTESEARKVLVEQANSTLVTIAKDVKLQIEFNPTLVDSYRLIGYENRVLAKEDFNDDQKDAGEIGAGHSVTALYEIVPAGSAADAAKPKVDELKYQAKPAPTDAAESDEMMTLKLRYKQPDGDTSTLVEFPVSDDGSDFAEADQDTRFAAAVAGFGMQLRRSEYKGNWTLSDVIRVAEQSKGEDAFELRAEFIELAQNASDLMGQE
ncbi:von Willebrand factor [Novipirellula galeiformis]|uniref:von Willebrand factor n=1 Tax=Novipirellula galeiformis TaxID=2528004 RepID=A0A5C6BDJ8_9BACT|nr:VWA domain-containing protein [Novipirellula galeiformis]TWU10050.1 von Willebrand factor [Novipirellula galeiformis]